MIAEFCDRLVAHDLPDLPAERRSEVVAFAVRRIEHLPSPMRLGVGVVASIVGVAGRLAGTGRVAAVLARHPVPVFGEYVRLVRSLSYAYVWDTWPDTSVSGAVSGA
jgi:hypothetical protein